MLLTSEGDNSLLISLILALSHWNMAGISDDKLDSVLLEALLLYMYMMIILSQIMMIVLWTVMIEACEKYEVSASVRTVRREAL